MAGSESSSSEMASVRREEVSDHGLHEKLYVAVSKEVKACKSILLWALQNSGGKRICLIHVHQLAQTISILGGRFLITSLSEQEVRSHREKERKQMCKLLDEYLRICAKAGVQAEKLYIEMDSIEKGIVELISQHKIDRLVMGAAADNRYSRKMMEPKSKKANYVRQYAPVFCHTWFICKGRLIYTREGTKHSHLYDLNEKELELTNFEPRLTQSMSEWSTPRSKVETEGSFDDFDRASTFSLSLLSRFSMSSSVVTDSPLAPFSITEESEPSSQPEEEQPHSLSPSKNTSQEADMDDALYEQLNRALVEAETSKREAFQESLKRRKAEKEAIDAIRMAKAVENLYFKELRRRVEIEEELGNAKEELESTKKERDIALEELRASMDQKLLLERRVEESDAMGKQLGERIMFALEFLQNNAKL